MDRHPNWSYQTFAAISAGTCIIVDVTGKSVIGIDLGQNNTPGFSSHHSLILMSSDIKGSSGDPEYTSIAILRITHALVLPAAKIVLPNMLEKIAPRDTAPAVGTLYLNEDTLFLAAKSGKGMAICNLSDGTIVSEIPFPSASFSSWKIMSPDMNGDLQTLYSHP